MDSERSGVTRLTVFRFTRFDDIGLLIGLLMGCSRVSESVFSSLRAGEVELDLRLLAAVVSTSCRQQQDRDCSSKPEAKFASVGQG